MKDLQENLIRNIDFIKQADNKAALIATVLIALTGYVLAGTDYKVHMQSSWLAVLLIIWILLFAITSYFIARSIHPTIREEKTKHSLIYYGTIATMDLETFKQKRSEVDDDKLDDFMLDQVYATSLIASSKMKSVQRAFYALVIFVILSLIHEGVLGASF